MDITITTRTLRQLAHTIDRHGMAAVESALPGVVDAARAAGTNPTVVAVLADPSAPEVARARAFGIVAMHLTRAALRPPAPTPVPSPAVALAC